jgi:hypothetical protein
VAQLHDIDDDDDADDNNNIKHNHKYLIAIAYCSTDKGKVHPSTGQEGQEEK